MKNDPEFWEAYGFRGEAALARGELLSAEKDLLIASEHIPESAYYNILLASVYFFHGRIRAVPGFLRQGDPLSPEYRDAYLTKAICLSQLGRYPEALGVLDRIIEMQYYLQGEAHYWSAWNQHALKDLADRPGPYRSGQGDAPDEFRSIRLGRDHRPGKRGDGPGGKRFHRSRRDFNAN